MKAVHISISKLPKAASLWFALKNTGMSAFYAVRRGRKPGIYSTWDECKKQINGFPGPIYKKFPNKLEALKFIHLEEKSGSSYELEPSLNNALSSDFRDLPRPETYIKLGGSIHDKNKKSPTLNVDSNHHCNCTTEIQTLKSEITQLKATVESLQTQINEAGSSNRRKSEDEIGNDNKKCKFNDGEDTSIIYVYTDGACTNNGKQGARAGLGVYFGDDHELNLSERIGGKQTNNRAEIHAAIRALQQIKKMPVVPKKVVLYTDSDFLIKSITSWIKNWRKNGWKVRSGEEVKNKEDFLELDEVMQGLDIEWVHVKGHSGIKGNEAADTLAVQALGKPSIETIE